MRYAVIVGPWAPRTSARRASLPAKHQAHWCHLAMKGLETLPESPSATTYAIELNRAPFAWDLAEGRLSFFNLPSALFWLHPSLFHMLQPLAHEIGVPLFRLLVAYSSSLGTAEDYHSMVTILGQTFEEGFLAWGRAVATAGWGWFELPQYDAAAKRATVRVRNPWELQMQ